VESPQEAVRGAFADQKMIALAVVAVGAVGAIIAEIQRLASLVRSQANLAGTGSVEL
jgi:hypothetical protein